MEIALILYMCSAVQKTCLDPYVWPSRFDDKYNCMVQGYEESGKKSKTIPIAFATSKACLFFKITFNALFIVRKIS